MRVLSTVIFCYLLVAALAFELKRIPITTRFPKRSLQQHVFSSRHQYRINLAHGQSRSSTFLAASDSDDTRLTDSNDNNEKQEAADTNLTSSKDQPTTTAPPPVLSNLISAYRVASYIFVCLGAFLLVMPDRTMNTMVSTKFGGAAGYGMAAGLCHILKGAAKHNRLNSDTYKRLSVGLLGFTLLSLFALPGEAGFLPTAVPSVVLFMILTLSRLLGASAAYRGWVQGVRGDAKASPRQLGKELYQGTLDSIKGLRVQFKQKALTYRNLLLIVIVSCFSSIMEGIFDLRYKKDLLIGNFEISLQWSAVARLFMISTMIYSLKDAAERDRLTGTTFIQLNLMIGLWAVLVGIGQAIYPLGFAAYRGVEMFIFSGPFFVRAIVSLQKQQQAKLEKAS